MRFFGSIFVLILSTLYLPSAAQENHNIPQQIPEQEAARQTERLQQELHLTRQQVKQVYEINLKYARERQISNKRSEALERTKNKNKDLKKVLSKEQFEQLQNKRYERSNFNIPKTSGYQTRTSHEQSETDNRSSDVSRERHTGESVRSEDEKEQQPENKPSGATK
ncbi:MAG: hypothetical protein LBH80_02340 [Prevotellaceae bacterium]|jgi:hypothetical protein|nr:hypothetical protein [Prevotellaceae bacterium]